ncbi:MAG: hypothetical protein H7257_14440, partial [Taibaiella sp.]|nr:hypothetical protein [Taibaiella sp.]
VVRNGVPLPETAGISAVKLYELLGCNYPKFFKMDGLCRWAWLASECLLGPGGLPATMNKDNVAVVLTTAHGCLAADMSYLQTIAMPSPALFVYTLPNIMLGEICIRQGIKGEQMCMLSDGFDSNGLFFTVTDLLRNRDMDGCLCGWVDVNKGLCDVLMCWVTGDCGDFNAQNLAALYDQYQ